MDGSSTALQDELGTENSAQSAAASTPAQEAAPAEKESATLMKDVEQVASQDLTSPFTSLYYTSAGTITAIAFGLLIVAAVQLIVARIFRIAKTSIEALTFFATSMVAFLVAIYLCDLLIAGPNVMLLHEGERSAIVNFVKDTCLMVFAYFFGTKSAGTLQEVTPDER
jgi:hypothetical protein